MRRDVWYALRGMVRSPGVFAVAVFTLAFGIGANTAMFSVLHAVLLRPLPYRDSDRLVSIHAEIPHLNISGAFVEYNTFVDWWRPGNRSFESMAAFSPRSAVLMAGGQPERIHMLRVTASYLSVIGTAPALGRDFLADEDRPGAPRVVLLSAGLWKRRFGAQREVLGRSILLDQAGYTVVGVLSPEFDLDNADVFVPIAHSGARERGMPTVGAYARLKRGVSLRAAQADLDNLCRGWVRQYHYPQDWGARIWLLHDYMIRDGRTYVVVLAVAIGLVLLIACANVANLLLARAAARRREIAIRTALGAGRGSIIRQLLTESAVLGTISTGLGILLAWPASRAIAAADAPIAFSQKVTINGPVLGFSIAVMLLTTALFGLVPALAAARPDIAGHLKEGGRGGGEGVPRPGFRTALVVVEVALALLLVIGASFTLRSLGRLLAVDPGFNPKSLLTADIALPESAYSDPARRSAFFERLVERVGAAPGVKSVAIVSDLPFGGSRSGSDVVIEGATPPRPDDRLIAFVRSVDPGYFTTLQARLVRGRLFTAGDAAGAPVAIINQTMARRCWPNQDPIGRRFAAGSGNRSRQPAWLTVAGVIADMHNTSLAEDPDLEYYLPYAQYPQPNMSLAVRTALDPLHLASALRAAVGEIDKDLPVSDVSTLENRMEHAIGPRRLSTTLLAVFSLLAVSLACIGVYGVVSYSVTQRTHEMGVRLALGATPGRILALVVSNALLVGAAGAGLGIVGGIALMRLLHTVLFGVSAGDPMVFAAAAIFLLAVCAVSAYPAARRAARVDPIAALRHE